MIAKMKRASTPVDDATDVIALLMLEISSSVGLATLHCVQLPLMFSRLLVNLKWVIRGWFEKSIGMCSHGIKT
jgi:hypothetical protein